jgi:hypothetical protein
MCVIAVVIQRCLGQTEPTTTDILTLTFVMGIALNVTKKT